ncbi:Maltooligosyl trehalose synthase [Anatilimnocola aggregata]|uniref:Maltooligosyl trehalose synthase n=2 Tax=Anatilimnocola aggregata TaxID=2528021 RepID=A0A517YIS6_9BACT|nr:Maltooligosyl trehalose synthase [Anatilimnocola aggregata]
MTSLPAAEQTLSPNSELLEETPSARLIASLDSSHLASESLLQKEPHMSLAAAGDTEGLLAAEWMAVAERQAQQQVQPAATYRLQLHHKFRFTDATAIIPYLQRLGVSHCYASPYLKAVTGSEHGYDIVDHGQLNPEIGSEQDFDAFVAALRQSGMGHILDFVPNHMGVASNDNLWWQDVLENGPSSQFAIYFDIDWSPLKSELANKVLLPVLGDQFGRVLENQQLQLEYADGSFLLRYYERSFPIAPRTYSLILGHRLEELTTALGAENPAALEYQSILTAINHLPPRETTDPAQRAERDREKEIIKRRLRTVADQEPTILNFIQKNVQQFNGEAGNPQSFDRLEQLLEDQAYRLSHWRVASDEINYRRFFDVNGLAAVCMEQPEVFARSHAFVLKLIADGKLDGLRIDHADGLYDPAGYLLNLQIERWLQFCRAEYDRVAVQSATQTEPMLPWESFVPRLRQLVTDRYRTTKSIEASKALYVVVEKILERNERLPIDWPVAGTSGYDFLVDVNSLFVDSRNEKAITSIYERFISDKPSFEEMTYHSKRLIMKVSMASELHVLSHQLDRISECQRWSHDFTLNGLTLALREIVACFPVYRTYTVGDQVRERDRAYVEQAVARAKRKNPADSHHVYDFIREVLLHGNLERASERERQLRLNFVGRFQQFTGPMMAKAVEDTTFYRYLRLISLNEVGGDPSRFGLSTTAFHQQNLDRQNRYPRSLTCLSTHDTKRSEDVRARINTLSEIPTRWKECVLRWSRWNKRKKIKVDGELAPSRNDEYLLYQTLLGSWPAASLSGSALDEYIERICQYLSKALREAKTNSSWIAPNEAYEHATHDFVKAILAVEPASAFRVDFEPFADLVTRWGWWNSMSQTLLKLTSPGVPDTYPGTEVWSLTLVDPDNRRPVDFRLLDERLRALEHRAKDPGRAALLKNLVERATDGNIKLFIHQQALQLRRELPELFTGGQYVPLEVSGSQAEHICAFARIHEGKQAIVIVPRMIASLVPGGNAPVGDSVWMDAAVLMPASLRGEGWQNVFSTEQCALGERLQAGLALANFPVSLWLRK